MTTLTTNLQKTITNLEKIRDSQDCPSKELTLQLDRLYQKQLDLVSAKIAIDTEKYKSAETSIEEAAKVTREAVDNIAKIDQAIEKVTDVLDKVASILPKIL